MKKKLLIITIIIAIIGALVVIFKGFNVSSNYRAHKSINIPINADFNIEDVQTIADEIFGKKNAYLERAGVYNDSVVINVKDVSDEQLTNLKNKINEKYQPKQKITISIGKEDYNVDDIKAIANEVFAKEDSVVEKSTDDAKYVTIEANIITNDELEKLNSKINEKYELKNETTSKTTFGDWSANIYVFTNPQYQALFEGQNKAEKQNSFVILFISCYI